MNAEKTEKHYETCWSLFSLMSSHTCGGLGGKKNNNNACFIRKHKL